MGVIDKKQILERVDLSQVVKLELGCGDAKRNVDAIGIDALDFSCVDIVGDVYAVLSMFPDKSVDAVYSYHFVEHVADVPRLLSELARVLKPAATVEFVAPHFSNPYFYSDPTHRSFFGLYTFCYYARSSLFSRKVPTYDHDIKFDVISVDLIFKSSRPFYVRYVVKRLFGLIFNSCYYFRELYEENFCYLVPCYEVKYLLRRHEDSSVI